MALYRSVVVGTDGSESSFRAVERAAEVSGAAGATLYIATAYQQGAAAGGAAADALKGEAFQITGSTPAYEILRAATDRAKKAGAQNIEQRAIEGKNPVDALIDLVIGVKADLLVVGNRGLSSITGRLLGSVPSDVARRADIDVLIVHTV
ncbi:UspA domain protein [Segniliparus rotundus DSM 44985]|uniref:UspA domain protein n=1 Tax=Segniliparus rotundus (strain ATCC BAA-972 / CDC 1076 / CIP 108378 / DSM 44985 / JCM 13578) TaxID=640132 RepID=D6ZF92_SEGRD|nr:universal stress protein [Segniliparus rotundus]ADG97616.1 UspA domain protein [Segniliparus rotundus DSM 44985]